MKVYTIRDIAKLAGVSVTTVSRVLNHRPDVNSDTRARVEQIIRETQFVASPSGSASVTLGSTLYVLTVKSDASPPANEIDMFVKASVSTCVFVAT